LTLILFRNEPVFGVLVFIVGFFDGVDGAVAKGAGTTSKAGAITDSVIDKVSEVTILCGIALAFPNDTLLFLSVPIWVLLCISGWLLTSYTRSRAESLGAIDLDIGIGARSERLLTLVLFSLIFLLLWGLVIVTIMGLLTAAYRFHHYKRELLSNTSHQSDHYT
jgi:phosphatidylglycerophosphate synthase